LQPRTHALIQNDYVEIWTPCELLKAGDSDGPEARPLGKIRGITSSEIRDLDGEIIVQKGLDWTDALEFGHLTHEHPLGSLNIVGYPERVEPTTVTKGDKEFPATLLEGSLYLDDKTGKELWEKGITMQKAGGRRALGLSIEGRIKPGARKRGGFVDGIMVKSVAISSQPRNRTSWWKPVMRGLVMSQDPDHPLAVEPQWLEQATWKAEALGMLKAETVGYPTQAVANANGISNLVPQSVSGGKANASWGGGDKGLKQATGGGKGYDAKFGLDPKLLRGMRPDDLAVARILKKMPELTWAQGIDVLRAFQNARTPFEVKP
jgi:hypothetical protein